MRLIDRYIGRTVAVHTAVVLLILLAMYTFSSFVAEVDNVGKGTYTFLGAAQYIALLVPRQAYELFPLVALLGSMLGLGALAGSSELTVIRAVGVSVRRLSISVLKIGALLMLVALILGEVIAPPLEKYARIERAKALAENISVNTDSGLWARDENTFIQIERLLPDGLATGITLYRLGEDGRLAESLSAPRGEYEEGGWLLYDVKQSRFTDEGIRVAEEAQMRWRSSLTPGVVNVVAIPPENLSAYDLFHLILYLRENGLDSSRYELAFWVRVVAPFATAGMVLLALPFVFGSLRAVSIGQRVMVGALLGIGFYLFNAIFNRLGLIYHLPPFLAATVPPAIVFGLWVYLMRRIR